MITRIANGLLRHRDAKRRRQLILMHWIALLLFFAAHTYFSNLSSPLKLIPQMFSAMAIGYVILSIFSLRAFKYVAEFIDWDKVAQTAASDGIVPHRANKGDPE